MTSRVPGPPHHADVLTYAALDNHAFACRSSEHSQPLHLPPGELGPQIEHLWLALQNRVPAPPANALVLATQTAAPNRLLQLEDNSALLQMAADPAPGTVLTSLKIRAKQAAVAAGFSASVAGQLAAATSEAIDNIIEHSERCGSGIVAFRGSPGLFEFVAADQGVGVLASLRTNPAHAALTTAREALPLILQPGITCTGDPNRGQGFEDLFRGLANHNGRLRFRSGDALVTLDGQSPNPLRPKVKERVLLAGLIMSVCCMPS